MDTYKVKVDNGRRQEIFHVEKRYVELRPVSEGSYGFVAAAKDTVHQRPVAIKKIANFLRDLDDAKRISREIKLLTHLGGRAGVIEILDVMTSPPNTTDFTDVYIVCPLMESDLERIITSDQPLTDAHAQYFRALGSESDVQSSSKSKKAPQGTPKGVLRQPKGPKATPKGGPRVFKASQRSPRASHMS